MRPDNIARLLLPFVLILYSGPTATATAKPRASVAFTLPAAADAGKPAAFRWQARRVPATARLALQRQFGTARTWKTVVALGGRGGNGNVPALGLGAYQVRIAALGKGGKVLAQQQRKLRVFGTVPLSTLASVASGASKGPGTHVAPSHTFNWFVQGRADSSNPNVVRVSAAANACRSLNLDFTVDAKDFSGGEIPVTLTIVQQAADAVSRTVAPNAIGAIDATLTPGQSWALNGFATFYVNYYLNGSASCYSATPWP